MRLNITTHGNQGLTAELSLLDIDEGTLLKYVYATR